MPLVGLLVLVGDGFLRVRVSAMKCANFRNRLPDLLFEAPGASGKTETVQLELHARSCESCARELTELRSTMDMLSIWRAPEPSPYFNTRMAAKLREERNAPSAGFLERMRARFLFGSNKNLRPVMAGALGLVLLVSGGTYAGLSRSMHPVMLDQASATVSDLQSLDRNEQTIDQLDQLLQDGQDAGASNAPADR